MDKNQKVKIIRYSFKEKGDCSRFLDTLRKCNVDFILLETEVALKNKISIVIEYKKDIFE